SLDLLILKTLTWAPRHGYAIARWIEQTTGAALTIEEGALYPALHRLEERGYIEGEWVMSQRRRRVREYSITPLGRAQLRVELGTWTDYVGAMQKVLEGGR